MPFPRKVGKPQISREYPSLELRGIHSEEEEDGRSPKTHLGEARSSFLVNLGEFGISWGGDGPSWWEWSWNGRERQEKFSRGSAAGESWF